MLAAYVSLRCRSRSRAVVAARSPGPDRDRHASRVAAADPSFLDTRAYDNTLLTHHMPVENGHATDEAHFVARKSHSDTIAARGLRQRGGRSKLLFSCRRASQRLVRRRWQLLSSEQRPIRGVSATSFSASKVRSAADSPCSAGGMREASSSTRRHGWAGQSSPAVRGVLASATVDVGMVSSEASAAHQAPRPDLLYRSGGGAFKRL